MLELRWQNGILAIGMNAILDFHTRDQVVAHRIQAEFAHLALFDERTMFPLPFSGGSTHPIPAGNLFRGHIVVVEIGSRDGADRGLLVPCLDGRQGEAGLSVALALSPLPLRRLLSLGSLTGGFVLAHSLPRRGGEGSGEVTGMQMGSLVHTVDKICIFWY